MTTMKEVALRAGVSATTVSFVLNGRQPANGPISEETQGRVLAAAKELGYRHNSLAKAIVAGHNRTIGFLGGHLWHEFSSRILSGALKEARIAEYGVQILQLQNNVIGKQAIESCLEMRLAGLLTIDLDPEVLEYLHSELRPYNIPIGFIDTSYRQDWGIHVTSDDAQGCHLAVSHLVELGHTRIAFIGGQIGRGMANSRDQFFLDAMKSYGLKVPEGYAAHGDWSTHKADEVATKMLGLTTPPTAIFCANDEMAFGVQRAARRMGLQLPRDLSVVGFSNLSIADMADPPLTTVGQPIDEIGHTSTRLLLEKIQRAKAGEDVNAEPVDVVIPTTLVVRESTAPLKISNE